MDAPGKARHSYNQGRLLPSPAAIFSFWVYPAHGAPPSSMVWWGVGSRWRDSLCALAKAGYSVCLLERNTSLGGSASCYRVGTLTIEAPLQLDCESRATRAK